MRLPFALLFVPALAVASPEVVQLKIAPGGELTANLVVYPAAHRLYVLGSRIEAFELESGKPIDVPGLDKLDDYVLDASHDRAFAPDSSGALQIFDAKTIAPIASVPNIGTDDFLVADPTGEAVFAFDITEKHAVHRIDLATKKTTHLKLPARPDTAVVVGGRLYVVIDGKSILRTDAKTLKVDKKLTVKGCDIVELLALTPKGWMVAMCNDDTIVIDGDGNKIATFANPKVHQVVVDAKRNLLYVPSGGGKLTVIEEKSPTEYAVVKELATPKGARAALDPDTGKLYLASPVPKGDKGITQGALLITVYIHGSR